MASPLIKMALNAAKKKKNKIPKTIQNAIDLAQELKNINSFGPRKFNNRRRKAPNVEIGGQAFTLSNLGGGNASMSSGPGGTQMIVEKTEPILTVTAAGTAGQFRAQQEFLYPMNGNLLWLQNMANAFTSYEVLAFEVTYVPAVPTTATGAVSLAFYEDVLDDDPTSMGQMLISEQSLYAPVYAGGEGGRYLQRFGSPTGNVVSFMVPKHAYSDSNGNPKRFKVAKPVTVTTILGSDEVGKASLSDYLVGSLVVATEGCAAGQTIGQIFVRYKLRLSGTVSISNQI